MIPIKPIAFIIFLFIMTPCSYGQLDFRNHNLTDQQYKLVYAGCKNEMVIYGMEDVDFAYLTASASTVTQVNDSTYILKPRYRSHMDTLRLFINDELIQEELFLVMHPPSSRLQLGEVEGEYTNVKTILKNGYLNLIEGGFYKDYETIIQFKLRILDVDGNEVKAFESTGGNALTRGQLEYIKTLKQGHQLEFSDIQVRSSQGMKRRKPNYLLTIE